jgi:tryptophan halogenase
MSQAREPLRSIIVAGNGQLGALSALAVKKTLPSANVTVLSTPVDPANLADRAPSALPFTNRLHDQLGIEEEDILRRAAGSHRLVTRLIAWGQAAPEVQGAGQVQNGAMPYGMAHDPSLKSRFAQEWGGGSRSGTERQQSGREFAGSLAEVLAAQRRFGVPPPGVQTPIDEIDYCLRWNPFAYRELIIEAAGKAGVQHKEASILLPEPDGKGGLAGVRMDNGEVLRADIFIDCSGPAAILRTAIGDAGYEDWSEYLPIRKLAYARPVRPILALEDRFSLPQPTGWLGEFAGRDALQSILALPDETSEAQIISMLGADPSELVAISPGCCKTPWSGNVIALGDAAAKFEPLGFLNLDLAHRQLELLVEMLPGRTINPRERDEYNRRSGLMMDAVRDALGLHYAAPSSIQRFGKLQQSSNLERLIDQYARKGRVPFSEEAPFLSQEIMALLAALGISSALTPLAREDSAGAAEAARSVFNAKARSSLETTPPYEEWLRSVVQPTSP